MNEEADWRFIPNGVWSIEARASCCCTFLFSDSDYRVWGAYIDSIYNFGGTGIGMLVNYWE